MVILGLTICKRSSAWWSAWKQEKWLFSPQLTKECSATSTKTSGWSTFIAHADCQRMVKVQALLLLQGMVPLHMLRGYHGEWVRNGAAHITVPDYLIPGQCFHNIASKLYRHTVMTMWICRRPETPYTRVWYTPIAVASYYRTNRCLGRVVFRDLITTFV